jgi:hypothetical protein
VVIGILIALQINNWNENRKASIEETAILERLLENLMVAEKQSELLILEERAAKTRLIQLLGIGAIKDNDDLIIITDSIFNLAVWDLDNNIPTFNTYNNLKNTNKLSLINDKAINEKFVNLEFSLSRLEDLLEDRLSVHQIRIDDIVVSEINFIPLVKSTIPEIVINQELSNDYEEILKDRRIRNLLGIKLSFTNDAITRRQSLDKEIADLIALIDLELNKTNNKTNQP